jgi:hypothetical protein
MRKTGATRTIDASGDADRSYFQVGGLALTLTLGSDQSLIGYAIKHSLTHSLFFYFFLPYLSRFAVT